jgi:hypothetical protein
MACFRGKYVVFVRGIFPDEVVLPLGGVGDARARSWGLEIRGVACFSWVNFVFCTIFMKRSGVWGLAFRCQLSDRQTIKTRALRVAEEGPLADA